MTSYFVATNGSDSADGLSQATAWRTLAKVNGFTFTAGDQVFLNRGNRWKETLNVPANLAVIGAYGAAAVMDSDGYVTNAPVIDGGEFVTAWSAYSGGVDDSYAKDDISGTAGANLTASTMEVGGPWVNHTAFGSSQALITAGGRARRGSSQFSATYVTANPPSSEYGVEADFFVASATTGDRTYLMIRMDAVSQDGYGFNVDPAAGNFTLTRFRNAAASNLVTTTKSWTVSQTYRIRLEARINNNMPQLTGFIDGVQVFDFVDSSTSLVFAPGHGGLRWGGATAPASGSDSTGVHVKNFAMTPLVANATPVNTYQAALGTEAKIVEIRGAYAQHGESQNNLADSQFYWRNNKLYVRSDIGVPGNTDVVGGFRNNAIACGTRSNLTIQDVGIEHANDQSIVMTGGSGNQLVRVMMQRTSSGTGNSGTLGIDGHNNWSVANSVFRETGSDCIYGQNTSGVTVTDCKLGPAYGPNADCLQLLRDGLDLSANVARNTFTMTTEINSSKGCCVLQGYNCTFEDNYCEGANNFGVAPYGNNMIVRRNVFYRHGNGGAVRMRDPAADNVLVEHNVMIDCKTAIFISSSVATPRTNHRYYANTIVNVAVPPESIYAQVFLNETMSGEFKDNIVWNASGSGKSYSVNAVGAGGWASDFNLIGPEATGFISYQGSSFNTLAAFVASKSKDTHSVTSDPLFVNQGGHAHDGSDYLLQSASPAAGTGTLVTGVVNVANMGAMGALLPTVGSIAATSSVSGLMVAEVPRWKVTPSPRWELV